MPDNLNHPQPEPDPGPPEPDPFEWPDEDEPEPDDYDPGDAVDDQGGASERFWEDGPGPYVP